MAVSAEVEIANSALVKLGAERIISLDDANNRARLCKQQYPIIRDKVVYGHPWKCALARAELAVISPKPDGYPEFVYAFLLPSDCGRVLGFIDQCTNEQWTVNGRNLFANVSPLTIEYIKKITDVSKFDDNLCEVLAWALAADIAYALTQSTAQADKADKMFRFELSQARSFSAQQGSVKRVISDDWLGSRRY